MSHHIFNWLFGFFASTGKQADIAERLKLWREQKSKQKEQEKKNAPKGFTVSTKKLEHKEDAFLFQRKKKTTEVKIVKLLFYF